MIKIRTVKNLITNSDNPKNLWIYVLQQNDPTDPTVLDIDKETKITEFDFEKYLNPTLMQKVQT